MSTGYVPVEILGFQVQPEHIRKQDIECTGYVPDGV
jgi:hypothetical protein